MQDQASGLRNLNISNKKIIAITGGKGGVGKTNISVALSYAIAQIGHQVIIFDGDLNLGNVDVSLGLRSKLNISHVLSGACALNDIIINGPHGLQVIPSCSGNRSMSQISVQNQKKIYHQLIHLDHNYDFLVIDTAAGITEAVLSALKMSHDIFVIVCNEPSSITDAYALMKVISQSYPIHHFKIIVNMIKSYQEGQDLFSKLTQVTNRFLKVNLELAACIPLDENIRNAAQNQKTIIEKYPNSPASLAINSLANKIVGWSLNKDGESNLQEDHIKSYIGALFKDG